MPAQKLTNLNRIYNLKGISWDVSRMLIITIFVYILGTALIF